MTPTPRTDSECGEPNETGWPSVYISADFARQLERENAELLEALDGIASIYENPEPPTMHDLSARAYDMRCIARAAIAKSKGNYEHTNTRYE